jgi:acyl carrier protein
MTDKIKAIMSQVFDVPVEDIGSDASIESIDNWDSVNHMSMIMALEQSYEVLFETEEIIEMVSYRQIVHVLKQKRIL